jgi:hypothetical protein
MDSRNSAKMRQVSDGKTELEQIKPEDLVLLHKTETARDLYGKITDRQRVEQSKALAKGKPLTEKEAVKREIWRLTNWGIIKYGGILCIMEISSLASIFVFKLIIDFL